MKHAVILLLFVGMAAALDHRLASAVTITWTPVGNPGNAADPADGDNGTAGVQHFGAVAYSYRIGTYDVTVGQYTEFLNAVAKTDTYGLYNPSMASDLHIAGISRTGSSGSYTYGVIGSSANLPITYVGLGDAERFANWLQNGQPTGGQGAGTTETGAYTLNGAVTNAALNAVTRNAGATIFIPSENEWYKAAYYNPATKSYYRYPFSSNTTPTSAMPGSMPNTANFSDPWTGYAVTQSTSLSDSQNYLTAVGAYIASASPYGAFDMGGDAYQWNEALISGSFRGRRGGGWGYSVNSLASSTRGYFSPTVEHSSFGFRVASVPEPSTAVLAALGALGLLIAARRNR